MLTVRTIGFCTLVLVGAATVQAQSPTPASSGSPSATPKPSATAAATASPSAPTVTVPSVPKTEDLINSLGPADIQAAITLLKSNFTKPDAINETELNRATLQGLLTRLGHGLTLLPEKSNMPAEVASPFFAEVLDGHVGYIRLGTPNAANLQALDKKLTEFGGKKADALAIDLRSSNGGDFNVAAEVAKRFVPKGKMLFALKKQNKQDQVFTSDRDPSYSGLIVLLTDVDTAGPSEAIAAALRFYDKALIIGQTTGGRAAEYSDSPLPSGKVLRMANSEAVGPDNNAIFPAGVKADLPVEMSPVEKRQVFQASMDKGMAQFVTETERPHLNEAALIAGTNPELESSEQRRSRNAQDRTPRDAVLQRALDLVTSLEVFSKR